MDYVAIGATLAVLRIAQKLTYCCLGNKTKILTRSQNLKQYGERTVKLVIGNKNYSSWSLRPWLLLRHFSLPFDELHISLGDKNRREILRGFSPSSKVPVLVDGDITVWDTLSICEYLNEQYLEGRGWPMQVKTRATARAVVAEMHAGFSALRIALPMNCRARRRVKLSEEVRRDIARIDEIWSQAEQFQNNGQWLFGEFGIADCFFAPVAFRFQTYGIHLSLAASEYCERLLNHNGMRAWKLAALEETEILKEEEVGEDLSTRHAYA